MVQLTSILRRAKTPEYWRRYLDRIMNAQSRPARYVPLRGWVGEDKRHDWIHSNLHPATEVAQQLNANTKLKKKLLEDELIEPIKEWTIQLGDRVELMVGRDKGKQGLVKQIVYERNWVFVEGLNNQIKRDKFSLTPPQLEEMPLDATTEVALVDPVTEKAATKVEWRFTEQGERVRQVYPSQVILRPTKQQYTLPDGVDPATYMPNPKTDTVEKDIETETYQPKLKSFKQDILDSMGIKETRKRGKTYWY